MSDMAATPFSALLAALEDDGEAGFSVGLPPDWRQGRTAFGGIAAALAVAVSRRAVPDLPGLRAAQFAFIGPLAGRLRAAPSVLRRGRSVTFMAVDVTGEAGLGLRALLAFGSARPSRLAYAHLPPPAAAAPDDCGPLSRGPSGLTFLSQFETRLAGTDVPLGGGTPDLVAWVRHADRSVADAECGLVAIGDALPPSPVCMLDEMPPLSSMAWGFEMSGEVAAVRASAWFLVRRRAEIVADGYASERVTVWSEAGTPLLTGSQQVAVFA